MIFKMGWLALILVWCSGLLAGRAVAAVYAADDSWFVYASISAITLIGVMLGARLVRT